MKLCLQGNVVEMYQIDDEGKSVVAERSIRKLKNQIYRYRIWFSKNVYVDELDNIVNSYNK